MESFFFLCFLWIINNNLHQLIYEIYKKWFINFEFPNEEGKSYKSYEGTFEEIDGELIPTNWTIDYLGSGISTIIIGSGIDYFDEKIYLATADVEEDIIINKNTYITFENKPSRANMQPIPKSVWFAKMKDSRKLIMVDDNSPLLDSTIFSRGFCGLKCVNESFYYIWSYLLTKEFDTMKNNFCTGTTMEAINNKDVKKITFVLPKKEVLKKYNSYVKPLFNIINSNNEEIDKLSRLRDTLLPKLMSGEIDVSGINFD